mmetsp:Transcript_6563/g.17608  ORF Transcript_6563/g.17608 Transcript_6563/m.17608 type:complete len:720 (+) Transcript_6563:145-2304(+)
MKERPDASPNACVVDVDNHSPTKKAGSGSIKAIMSQRTCTRNTSIKSGNAIVFSGCRGKDSFSAPVTIVRHTPRQCGKESAARAEQGVRDEEAEVQQVPPGDFPIRKKPENSKDDWDPGANKCNSIFTESAKRKSDTGLHVPSSQENKRLKLQSKQNDFVDVDRDDDDFAESRPKLAQMRSGGSVAKSRSSTVHVQAAKQDDFSSMENWRLNYASSNRAERSARRSLSQGLRDCNGLLKQKTLGTASGLRSSARKQDSPHIVEVEAIPKRAVEVSSVDRVLPVGANSASIMELSILGGESDAIAVDVHEDLGDSVSAARESSEASGANRDKRESLNVKFDRQQAVEHIRLCIEEKNGILSICHFGMNSDDLDSIWPEILSAQEHFFIVRLSSNLLTRLPHDLNKLTRVCSLCLDFNMIDTIPGCIGQMHHLRVLSLRSNRLSSLPDTFDQLCNLRVLNVKNNRIKKIQHGFCSRLRHLQVLDVARNMLTELPADLGYLQCIDSMDLSENSITHVPQNVLRLRGKLKEVNFDGNPIARHTGWRRESTERQFLRLQFLALAKPEASNKRHLQCDDMSVRISDRSDSTCNAEIRCSNRKLGEQQAENDVKTRVEFDGSWTPDGTERGERRVHTEKVLVGRGKSLIKSMGTLSGDRAEMESTAFEQWKNKTAASREAAVKHERARNASYFAPYSDGKEGDHIDAVHIHLGFERSFQKAQKPEL